MNTPSQRDLAWMRRMAEWDRQSELMGAKQEGFKTGEEKGRAEGREEGQRKFSELINKLLTPVAGKN